MENSAIKNYFRSYLVIGTINQVKEYYLKREVAFLDAFAIQDLPERMHRASVIMAGLQKP